MWEWEQSHSYIFMIKEIIASTMLTASIGIQNTTNNIQNFNTYAGTTNIYTQESYILGELQYQYQYKILEYNTCRIGNYFTIKARTIQYLERILNDNPKTYRLRQKTIFKIENPDNLNWFSDVITLNAIIDNYPTTTQKHCQYFYFDNWTNELDNFINGENYNTYAEMNNLDLNIDNNRIFDEDIQQTSNIYTIYNDQYYFMIEQYWKFDPNEIADNGAGLVNINPNGNGIPQNIYYTVPNNPNVEVIDLPGLLFEILGMPFAWISTAFNFTIFPGTQYAVNISQILMAIVIGLIGIYIVKKFIK